jgi:hypothetical protein
MAMSDCASGQCMQGVCCDKACGGGNMCETCNLGGVWSGHCTPNYVGQQGACGTGMACAANQMCQSGLANGATCMSMGACVSGLCFGQMCLIPAQPSGYPCTVDFQCMKPPPSGGCNLATNLCK